MRVVRWLRCTWTDGGSLRSQDSCLLSIIAHSVFLFFFKICMPHAEPALRAQICTGLGHLDVC